MLGQTPNLTFRTPVGDFPRFRAISMTREGWQSAIIQYRLYIGMMPLRLRGRLKPSRLVEAARELAIGIVFELGGDDRPFSRDEQELVILAQRADRSEERRQGQQGVGTGSTRWGAYH